MTDSNPSSTGKAMKLVQNLPSIDAMQWTGDFDALTSWAERLAGRSPFSLSRDGALFMGSRQAIRGEWLCYGPYGWAIHSDENIREHYTPASRSSREAGIPEALTEIVAAFDPKGGPMPSSPSLCPKCNGQKHVQTPPNLPGDQPTYASDGIYSYACPVCNGEGVLWHPSSQTPATAKSVLNQIEDHLARAEEILVRDPNRVSPTGSANSWAYDYGQLGSCLKRIREAIDSAKDCGR